MKFIKLNSSIKSKLISISILLLLAPMLILSIMGYQKSAASLDELGKTNLRNSVEHTIEFIEILYEQVENGALSLEDAQEKVKIAILGEMQEDGTRPINNRLDLGENGYLFVVNASDGLSVANPGNEGESSWDIEDSNGNKFVQEFISKGVNGGGFTMYDYPLPNDKSIIEEKVVYSNYFPEWDWVVSAGAYLNDFNQPANEIRNLNYLIIGMTLLIGIFIILVFANSISKPIKKVSEHMSYIAAGDLTQDQIQIKEKDETGQLGEASNMLQRSLRELITRISNSSEKLFSQSEELSQSTSEVKTGAEQVSITMQELAAGSEKQANSASDLAAAIHTFASRVQETNENGERINKNSKNVLSMTEVGTELMEKSIQQMEKIDTIVQDSVHKVQGLDQQSQKISNLVTVIQNVADQTNLLALNAAIEAARAGEHGKGFAVVADEVRKLAEQVSESVTDITEIVANIQSESTVVADSLQDGYKEVERGTTQIETTGQTFGNISDAVMEMVQSITTISENLSEITAHAQEMNSTIEDIASISEESSAGIEQTSASAQQASSTMEEVAGSTEQLAKLAEELNELVGRFKI